jgi:uncharacterized protein (DUF1330 family)
MRAYFILTHTINDPQKYVQEYIPGVMPFLAKHKAEVVVAELAAKPLEGDPAKGVVVLRFPRCRFVPGAEGPPASRRRCLLISDSRSRAAS